MRGTPLTVLSARVSSLDDTDVVRKLRADIDELARITSQLLQLNEIETMPDRDGTVADLGAIGEAVRDELATRAANRHLRIELTAPPVRVLVTGDPNVIEIAVRNLAENAIEHSPEGSAIGIRVASDGQITVSDAGPGIAADLREKVFEPFWSGDPHGTRAGLGLAIVRRVAERYGGTVAVASACRDGALFTLGFPPAPADPCDPRPAWSGVPASLAHRYRQGALGPAAG